MGWKLFNLSCLILYLIGIILLFIFLIRCPSVTKNYKGETYDSRRISIRV